SIYYDTLANNYTFAPFAKNDLATVFNNVIDTINVLVNDTDCSGSALTVLIISGPSHGTANLLANYEVAYTATAGYTGFDSIYYRDTNGTGDTSDALLILYVRNPSGINDVSAIPVSLYPIPASNELNIQFENPGKCEARIYDMIGNLVVSKPLTNNNNQIDING